MVEFLISAIGTYLSYLLVKDAVLQDIKKQKEKKRQLKEKKRQEKMEFERLSPEQKEMVLQERYERARNELKRYLVTEPESDD